MRDNENALGLWLDVALRDVAYADWGSPSRRVTNPETERTPVLVTSRAVTS